VGSAPAQIKDHGQIAEDGEEIEEVKAIHDGEYIQG
jgi:hypothetical protein